MARSYRDILGAINQRVAAVADEVVLMVAGCPLVIKHFAGGGSGVNHAFLTVPCGP
jgi:adenosylcobinamide kinase/adenosylcobinamide-phosphate guanylyltransferase